ncbi:MAG: oligoendopeptidase F [Limnochordaceae bacterium]|nr:oligoendopeptidase F [Limnochordaceae bacterium]
MPDRSQIPAEDKWRLEDIYPSIDAWEKDFAQVQQTLPRFRTFQGHLAEADGATLLSCLTLRDQVEETFERLFTFARMRRDEDNTNPTYQALAERAEGLGVQLGEATSFIVPEILTIPEDELRRFGQTQPGLAVYTHFLDELLRQKAHTLSTPEERLLALAGELIQAPDQIFTMLNDADLRFPSIVDEQGRSVELTKGRYIRFLESQERRVRKDAFQALYATYGALKNSWAAVLGAQVKRDIFIARARRYPNALTASLDDDNVPVEVYDNLIETVHQKLPLLHQYVQLRKEVLRLDELHMYDLYTPLVPAVQMKVPYEKAKEIALEALQPLGQEYLKTFREGLHSGWIDVWENRGKTAGAYSWGAYRVHPFVLLNYQSTLDDLFTLVHEMGHSLHTYYTQTTQPFIYSHYRIFVAEVASTLNEALLVHYLLTTLTDRDERLYVLNHYLEEFRGTLYRQTMFAEFEKLIHEHAERGGALTADWLNQTYYALNQRYFGSQIVIDPEIAWEWARIPHFYMNFYVYKYATGFSAAIALSQQILKEGEPAVQRYLKFLRSGSSDYPLNLLAAAGVDMRSPEPVRQALDLFGQLLDEMRTAMVGRG